jgi:hypothetical protein
MSEKGEPNSRQQTYPVPGILTVCTTQSLTGLSSNVAFYGYCMFDLVWSAWPSVASRQYAPIFSMGLPISFPPKVGTLVDIVGEGERRTEALGVHFYPAFDR